MTRKEMTDALVSNIDTWDIEVLIDFAKEVREDDYSEMSDEDLLEHYNAVIQQKG